MVPDIVKCESCGQMALVLSWSPLSDPIEATTVVDDPQSEDICCRGECSRCGAFVKRVALVADDDGTGAAA
jgi:hypothetical protein